MKQIFIAILILGVGTVQAQKKKKQDIKSILDMCGCFNISFNFAETFAPDPEYKFHDNYKSGALEYVLPISQDKDKVILQHLLIINDTMIIKHWRQDWIYQNTDLYTYDKDNSWKPQNLDSDKVKGQWTQKVFQVDDSPRYEGSGSWVHVDSKHYWEGTADAPLPRREFSKRSDYNVTIRRNRHEITETGWIHEQDNDKVIRSEDGDQVLAQEKGWNNYTKVSADKCAVAKKWWSKNSQYWADVRSSWDELFASKELLSINMKVDDKILFQRIFALGKEVRKSTYNSLETKEKIKDVIKMHLKDGTNFVSSK